MASKWLCTKSPQQGKNCSASLLRYKEDRDARNVAENRLSLDNELQKMAKSHGSAAAASRVAVPRKHCSIRVPFFILVFVFQPENGKLSKYDHLSMGTPALTNIKHVRASRKLDLSLILCEL